MSVWLYYRAEEEHAVGSGAIIAVQEEGDAGLGCVGWEASCQYHRRDPVSGSI